MFEYLLGWCDIPVNPTQNIMDSFRNKYYYEVEESEIEK